MEHKEIKYTLESGLSFISICSIRILFRNRDIFGKPLSQIILVRQWSILLCHAAMVRANPSSSPSSGSI